MTEHQLVFYPDTHLQTKAAKVLLYGADLNDLASEMLRVMELEQGVGLAAPQVGVNQCVIIVKPEPNSQPLVLVNPTLSWVSEEQELGTEGCLSLPGLSILVPRSLVCDVEFCDLSGKSYYKKCTGYLARIVQHEMDHLIGLTLLDKINRKHRKAALKGYSKP